VVGIAFAAVLLGAPVWQLARGRSDIRRSHAALSRAVWIPMGIVLLVACGYVVLLRSVSPTGLKQKHVEQVPGSSAVLISGAGPLRDDYYLSFFADAKSGKYVRLESPAWWGTSYSQDGKVAGWVQPLLLAGRPTGFEFELYTKRLDQPDAPVVATGLRTYGGSFAFSPDGSRVVLAKDTYSVHDLAANRILASAARPPAGQIFEMFFVDQNVVRLYQTPPNNQNQVDIYELDTRTKRLTKTGAIAASNPAFGLRVSQDGSRVMVPRSGILADGRTGAVIAQLPPTAALFGTGFLRDGTMVVMKREKSQPLMLHHFAADGTKLREFALPSNFAFLVGELDGGKLILTSRDKIGPGRSGNVKMLVADLASGRIVRTMNGISGPSANWTDSRTPQFRGDQPLVAANAEGTLVTWNPSTGEVKPFPK
jgi:hypothetical protein